MKKLTFISVLAAVISICFTVSAFAGDFYVIPVQKKIERVPKTGQTTFYYTGDDGYYQMGYSAIIIPHFKCSQ